MAKAKPIVALIYDFDGTLSPGNMQEYAFIQATGMSVKEFWAENTQLAQNQDADQILTYMFYEYRSKRICYREKNYEVVKA